MSRVPDGKSLIVENEGVWLKAVTEDGFWYVIEAGILRCTLTTITKPDHWDLKIGMSFEENYSCIEREVRVDVNDHDTAKIEASKIILDILKNFRMLVDVGIKELEKQSGKARARKSKCDCERCVCEGQMDLPLEVAG